MSLQYLPTELYDSILGHVPLSDLQSTALAVTRAVPSSPVPLYHLFRNIRITHPQQGILLYHRLRQRNQTASENETDNRSGSEEEEPASWVRGFSVESWIVDAEVIINVLRLLSKLQSLSIWVGPTNFSPEHLEELLSKPLALQYLSVRFQPYVQKATYIQFLKGAYYDSALLALARWPSGVLPVLSIIQDAFDPGLEQKQAFAQPIVFFRLDPCLSLLLHSPSMAPSLRALRLRIPSRPVARSICGTMPSGTTAYASALTPPPDLEFLDLSTCSVLDSEVDMILVHFPSLKHLILDGCSLIRGELGEGDWNALGKRCALAGVKRAKQREKALKAWIDANQPITNDDGPGENLVHQARRAKRGRKGLALATISLRDPGPDVLPSSSSRVPAIQTSLQRATKIRILPTEPKLETLCIGFSPWIKVEKHPMIRAEFNSGWAEGVALLEVTKARLKVSAKNGYRVMRQSPATTNRVEEHDELLDEEGLEDVEMDETESSSTALRPPILCFAGPGKNIYHEGNCGHSVGWQWMGDEL